MAVQYSIQKMVSDGTLSTVALGIQYLQRNDIYIRIAGEETPQSGASSGYTWSFVDNTTIKILPVVPNGVEVVVYRRTDADSMYNVYSQNAQFDEATIDENNTQLLFLSQEYLEQGSGIEAVEYLRSEGEVHYYRLQLYGGRYTDEFTITTQLPPEYIRGSGDFVTGFTVMPGMRNVAWLNPSPTGDNNLYSWSGEVPPTGKVVPPNSTPEATGGFVNGWVPRTDVTLRSQLAAFGGAGLVGPGVITRGADKFSILQGQPGEEFSGNHTRGIAVQLNSPLTGGAGIPVNTAQINLIEIKSDRLNVVDDTSLGTKVDGLMVFHRYGGAGTKGGRHAIEGTLSQNDITDSTNTDRNYVGVAGVSVSSVGDGGTSAADAKGTYYGGNFYGMLNAGANFCAVVTGAEFNSGIKTGASANIRSGIQIGSTGNDRGGVIDAAVMIGCGASNPAWRTGIHFGKHSGGAPLNSSSRAFRIDVDQVGSVISISPTTVVDRIIDHPEFILTPSRLAMQSSSALVEIGSGSVPGSTQLRYRTSGTGSTSDAAVIVSGGSSTVNTGNYEIKAGAVTYNCSQRPNQDNLFDYGAPSFRGRTAYFGTGTINTSDSREKTAPATIELLSERMGANPDAILDAWGDVQLVAFQWLAAIQEKGGDLARWHFGVIAQNVRDAFASHGLDGTRYGLLCYDEWEAIPATIGEDGEIVSAGIEAGNRWGIRPDQCLFLEAAYQRRNYERLLKRIEALENK